MHFSWSDSHGEEEEDEEDAEDDDDEDDEEDEAEEVGEENDRPYNLRQRKTVQRYEAPPIGIWSLISIDFFCMWVLQRASGLLKLPKGSFVEWLALVFSLRASEQKAEQPFPFWHPQIPSKKKPYKVCGNY